MGSYHLDTVNMKNFATNDLLVKTWSDLNDKSATLSDLYISTLLIL